MAEVNKLNNEESDNDSTITVINENTDINELDQLKAELTALKMFVSDQLYILKQSVGSPKSFECNCSHTNKNNDIQIKSLIDQIDYLKEENRIKSQIIQSLVHTRPSYSVHDNMSDNIINKSDSTNIINKGVKSSPVPIDQESDEFEDYKGDNLSDDVVTEDEKRCLDDRFITNRKKKKKKKKTAKNEDRSEKDHNEELNKTKVSSSPKSRQSVYILGDSMVKKLNGFFLTKNIKHKYLVKVRPFNSAKTRCMHDHAKPTIRDMNPEHIILHVGTNDLNTEKSASHIANAIIELANSLKSETNTIHVSLIVPRNDNLNNKANEVNSRLMNMCKQRNINIINHSDNIDPTKHLNESNLHLNRYGSIAFSNNFKKFLCNLQ